MDVDDVVCLKCGSGEDASTLVLCDTRGCNNALHIACCDPPMSRVPKGEWFCPSCAVVCQQCQKTFKDQDELILHHEQAHAMMRDFDHARPAVRVEFVTLSTQNSQKPIQKKGRQDERPDLTQILPLPLRVEPPLPKVTLRASCWCIRSLTQRQAGIAQFSIPIHVVQPVRFVLRVESCSGVTATIKLLDPARVCFYKDDDTQSSQFIDFSSADTEAVRSQVISDAVCDQLGVADDSSDSSDDVNNDIFWQICFGKRKLVGLPVTRCMFAEIVEFYLSDALKQPDPCIVHQPEVTVPVTDRINIGWFHCLKKWGLIEDGMLSWTCTNPNGLAHVLWQWHDTTIDVSFPGFIARLKSNLADRLIFSHQRVTVMLRDYVKHGALKWDSDEDIKWRARISIDTTYNPQLYYQTMIANACRLASLRPTNVTLHIWMNDNPDNQLVIDYVRYPQPMWSHQIVHHSPERSVRRNIGQTTSIERVVNWCTEQPEFVANWMHLPPALIPPGEGCIVQIL